MNFFSSLSYPPPFLSSIYSWTKISLHCDHSEKSSHTSLPEASLSPIFQFRSFDVHDQPANLLAIAYESVWMYTSDNLSPFRENKCSGHCWTVCPLTGFPLVTLLTGSESGVVKGSPRVGMSGCSCPRSGDASILCRAIYKLALSFFFLHQQVTTKSPCAHMRFAERGDSAVGEAKRVPFLSLPSGPVEPNLISKT